MSNDLNSIERFRVVYSAHYDDLWRYCLRRTNTAAEAEDVLSDVFTVAWRRFSEVPGEPDTRPWLFGVARNQLRNTWRKAARHRDLHLRLVADVEVTGATTRAPGDEVAATGIAEALHSLSESDAELLRLVAWEQLPHRDIALILDCTENAVAVRVHRARERLTEQLESLESNATNTPTHATATATTHTKTQEGDRS